MALKLEILLEAIDRISGPMRRAAAAVAALGRSANVERLNAALARTAGAAGQVAGRLAVLGAGGAAAGFAFNRMFIRPAADAENLLAVLQRFEGGLEGARNSMAWVSDFAARTPFEIGEVGSAFVRMRALGLDARRFLAPAGEAATALNVPLMQAVEAFADAATGEFERLKEFGIRASQEGDRVRLRWMQNGREMSVDVQRNNSAMIQSTLAAIWTSAYEGSMEARAQGWDGMMSMMSDAWQRFARLVMESGVFDWMKARLNEVLQRLERMSADGTLQAWAERVSTSLIGLFTTLQRLIVEGDLFGRIGRAFGRLGDAFERVQSVLSPIVGPFDALDAALVSLAAITFAPFIAALAGLGAALAVLAANPAAMAAMAALTALGLAGKAIYDNWDGIADWFGRQMDAIGAAVQRATDAIARLLSLRDRLSGESPTGPANDPAAQQQRRGNFGRRGAAGGFYGSAIGDLPDLMDVPANPGAAGAGGERVDLGGTLRVRIEDNRVTATGRMNDPRARIDVNQGVMVGAP